MTVSGVTPTIEIALKQIGEAPVMCHDLTPFARGRLAKLGFARKQMLTVPHQESGGFTTRLHYEITEQGRVYLRSSEVKA